MERKKHKPVSYLDDYIDGTVTMTGEQVTEASFDDFLELANSYTANSTSDDPSKSVSGSSTWSISTTSTGGTTGGTGSWKQVVTTPGTTWVSPNPIVPQTYPNTHTVPAVWTDSCTIPTGSTHITIHDENGNLKTLSIAEVSRYYGEALEYRRMKRFARLFPMVKELLNELLVAIKISDPLDDEELDRMEEELRESKKKK